MAGESKTTTDHNTIKKWVEERGGVPAAVKQTEGDGDPGVLRIHFPGYGEEETFDEVDWDTFFEKFEDNNLAFLYQEKTKDGKQSRFFKLVRRDS